MAVGIPQALTELNTAEVYFRDKTIDMEEQISIPSPAVQAIIGFNANGGTDFSISNKQMAKLAKGPTDQMTEVNGALAISVALDYKNTGNITHGRGVQAINHTPVDNITKAIFPFSQTTIGLGVPLDEYRAAIGSGGNSDQRTSKIIAYLTAKKQSAWRTYFLDFANYLYSNNNNYQAGILGLFALTGTVVLDNTTYGGIDRGTFNFFRSNVYLNTFADIEDMTSSSFVADIFNGATANGMAQGALTSNMCIYAGYEVYEAYRKFIEGRIPGTAGAQPNAARFDSMKGKELPGYSGLYTTDGIPVIYDPKAPDQVAVLLDMQSLKYKKLSGDTFEFNEWARLPEKTLMYTDAIDLDQLYSGNPRRHAYMSWS